jgi:anti-anti-sigma factor
MIGEIALESADGASIVVLFGEQDLATLPRLEQTLASGLAEGLPLIVDLSGVTFIDGATVGVLSRSRGEAETRGIPFLLALGDVTPRTVEIVLELAGCLAVPWVTKSRNQAIVQVRGLTS